MKKVIFLLVAGTTLLACSGGDSKKEKDSSDKTTGAANPDYQKGLELVAKYKCMSCHNVDATITGPAYRDVAKRYANSGDTIVATLAQKIIHGGTGNWGAMYMTPNSDVSQEDAESMVKYVLSLNK